MGKFTTLLRASGLATGLAVTVAMPAVAQDASTVLANVNGNDITVGHVIALTERLPEEYARLDDQVLFEGILEQLIQQAALADQIRDSTEPAVTLALENEVNAFLSSTFMAREGSAELSEADVQAAYDAQFAEFVPEEQFSAAHILVETEEEALEIIGMLEGGADFATLATERSTGPSGPRGGDLGWFGKGQMVPAFENAVLSLENGAFSPPVETQFGWHVVKRNDSRNTAAPDLETVRGSIENELRSKALTMTIDKAVENADVSRTVVEIDPSIIRNIDLLSE